MKDSDGPMHVCIGTELGGNMSFLVTNHDSCCGEMMDVQGYTDGAMNAITTHVCTNAMVSVEVE